MLKIEKASAGRWAPLALALVGVLLGLVALQEPATIEGRIGPGFMARILAGGVIGIAALLLLHSLVSRSDDKPDASIKGRDSAVAGQMLLGSVLAFGLLVPWLGLVPASAVSAGLAARAAGERHRLSICGVMLSMAALVALVGWALLPPTAPLWPWQ